MRRSATSADNSCLHLPPIGTLSKPEYLGIDGTAGRVCPRIGCGDLIVRSHLVRLRSHGDGTYIPIPIPPIIILLSRNYLHPIPLNTSLLSLVYGRLASRLPHDTSRSHYAAHHTLALTQACSFLASSF